MSEYRVKTVWMEHSGGTKFYQVIGISDDQGRHCTIGHYGPMSAAKGKGSRPINGGQTIVKAASSYDHLVSAKAKRGYRATEKNEVTVYSTEKGIQDYLTKYFSASDRHEIEEAIGLHEVRTIVPKGPADTAISEPEAPRPDGWGAW